MSKTNGGKPEVLNTKVSASMSTMPSLPELPQQQNIVYMLAVAFVFKTTGFPPFVLLTRLCHESHVIPLLDFRFASYELYGKFPTYFVGVFCSNLECILSHIYRKLPIYIGNYELPVVVDIKLKISIRS